jgi:hypothetical protein
MNKEMQRGLFRLLKDYQSYHKPTKKAKPVGEIRPTKTERSDPGNGHRFDQGEPLTLSMDYAEDIPYEPVEYTEATSAEYYSPSDALRYDLEHLGPRVEPSDLDNPEEAESSYAYSYEEMAAGEGDYSPVHSKEEEPARAEEMPALKSSVSGKQPAKAESDPADLLDDASFEDDLRAILSRKKQYTPPAAPAEQTPRSTPPNPAASPREEEPKDEHAIFEKIAQSMRLANAYDLGALELERRFDEFDAEEEKKK